MVEKGPRAPPEEAAPTDTEAEGDASVFLGAKTTGESVVAGFIPRKSWNIAFTWW